MVSGEKLCPTGVNHMPRGFLSLRITNSSPHHHLYVNAGGRAAGNYWVAFTLHFGGRKRRVRRSLGTKCLTEAIRLRDELFDRINSEGEDVPVRSHKATNEFRNAVEVERKRT